jgi:membrane protease YdiL (CAAX protease family)
MTTNRPALLNGVVFGGLFLGHLLLDRGRGTLWQFAWPLLAGLNVVVIVRRRTRLTAGSGARLGWRTGMDGLLVVLLLGAPLLQLLAGDALRLAAPAVAHPLASFAVIALGLLAVGLLFAVAAAGAGALAGAILGRGDEPVWRPRVRARRAREARLRAGAGRQFTVLFAVGLAGVLSLLLVVPQLLALLPRSARPALAPSLLVALSLVQPTVLLAVAVATGLALAPRLGLRSHLAAWAHEGTPLLPPLRAEAPVAVVGGVAAAGLVVLLDWLAGPRLGAGWVALQAAQPWTPARLVAGLLYGGLTEELLVRWGLLTLLAWLGWRVVQRRRGAPHPAIMWSAIVVAALLFGAGHLPAAGLIVPLTAPLVATIVLLNAAGGVVFGWLYWRRSLEAAMLAHATAHVVFAAAALLGR